MPRIAASCGSPRRSSEGSGGPVAARCGLSCARPGPLARRRARRGSDRPALRPQPSARESSSAPAWRLGPASLPPSPSPGRPRTGRPADAEALASHQARGGLGVPSLLAVRGARAHPWRDAAREPEEMRHDHPERRPRRDRPATRTLRQEVALPRSGGRFEQGREALGEGGMGEGGRRREFPEAFGREAVERVRVSGLTIVGAAGGRGPHEAPRTAEPAPRRAGSGTAPRRADGAGPVPGRPGGRERAAAARGRPAPDGACLAGGRARPRDAAPRRGSGPIQSGARSGGWAPRCGAGPGDGPGAEGVRERVPRVAVWGRVPGGGVGGRWRRAGRPSRVCGWRFGWRELEPERRRR